MRPLATSEGMMFGETHVTCPDCAGTGSETPDCWLCKGRMEVHCRHAYRNGWTKVDLKYSWLDDTHVSCPSCDGCTCDHCEGSGKVETSVIEQERDRVLIFALTQEIPPFRYPSRRGSIETDRLLSRAAAAHFRNANNLNWSCSVLGDEIYLRGDAAEAAARAAQVRHTLRLNVIR